MLLVGIVAYHEESQNSAIRSSAGPEQSQTSTIPEVTPSLPITEQLRADEVRTYRLKLLAGNYTSILITKGDANLKLTISNPGGQIVREFVSHRFGQLRASFISESAGDHLLEVRSLETAEQSRDFVMSVAEVRRATTQDIKDDKAVKEHSEAEKLGAEWKEESSHAAIKLYEEAANDWQAIARPRLASAAFLDAGDTSFALGEFARALQFYERGLMLARAAREQRIIMEALNKIGYVHANSDNNKRAEVYFRRVLRFCQGIRPAERSLDDLRCLAQVNNNQGEVYYYRGDLPRAKDYFNRALGLHLAAGDRRGQALAHLNLGYACSDSGALHNSLAQLAQSLNLWKAVDDAKGEALVNAARGLVLSFRGEKQNAFDAYNTALQQFRTIGDLQGEAAALNSSGKAYEDLNEPQLALDHYSRALKLFEQSLNRDAEAVTLYYLGRVNRALGDDTRALECYEHCLSLSRALGKHRIENYALVDIASIEASKGNEHNALRGFGKALNFYRQVKDTRGQAHLFNNIGDVYLSLAEYQKARSSYQKALTLSREVEDQRGEASMLYKVARAEHAIGDLKQALTDVVAAVRINESLRVKVGRQDLRSSFFASAHDQFGLYIELLMQMHEQQPSAGFAARAFEVSESARARTLLEILANADLDVRKDVAPELLERERLIEDSLAAKAQSQIAIGTDSGRDSEANKLEEETRWLTSEYQKVRGLVTEQGLHKAAFVEPQPLHLSEIQTGLLDDDTILLEYYLGERKSYLWAVTSTSLNSYELPPRREIEDLARETYQLLSASRAVAGSEQKPISSPDSSSAVDESYWHKAGTLSDILLGRVAAELGHKRLLIVPDSSLQYIPFDALPSPAAATANVSPATAASAQDRSLLPLVVNHEIVNLPSISTLAALRRRATHPEPAHKMVVVLADPVFEADDPRFQLHGAKQQASEADPLDTVQLRSSLRDIDESAGGLSRLPFTFLEAKSIMAVAPEDERAIISGFAANRQLVVNGGLHDYRIVHFATHGVINCRHPELTGIVLSMLNERGEHQNGFLQLHDIYKLDLSANLIVLSACRTGLGKDIRGEGLVGLTQGFFHSGANSMVSTLWTVDDRASAELMKYFYSGMLKQGLTPATALREAKLKIWQERRWQSPYYWAGFVLQGEYRESIKPGEVPSRWVLKTVATMILLIILVAIAARWKQEANAT
jgi:CHAT domain-containing protein/tetratricopeptide (TPR) repeat protein